MLYQAYLEKATKRVPRENNTTPVQKGKGGKASEAQASKGEGSEGTRRQTHTEAVAPETHIRLGRARYARS